MSNKYGTTVCRRDERVYALLDGADFYCADKDFSTYSAPATDSHGVRYICYWIFDNDDIADKDLEDLDWDYCDDVAIAD